MAVRASVILIVQSSKKVIHVPSERCSRQLAELFAMHCTTEAGTSL